MNHIWVVKYPSHQTHLIPIRDTEKQPTSAETEALRANQSLYDHLEQTQKARDKAYSDDPKEFTDILIDPAILEHERQFQILQKGPLNQLVIEVDAEEEQGNESDEGDDTIASSSPPLS